MEDTKKKVDVVEFNEEEQNIGWRPLIGKKSM